MPPGLRFPAPVTVRYMSALIDIVITFIAAMVSAAFVHFGAHSEKPRPAHTPTEQKSAAYAPAHPNDTESHKTSVEARLAGEQVMVQSRTEADRAVKLK